jgi:hypothetical protein
MKSEEKSDTKIVRKLGNCFLPQKRQKIIVVKKVISKEHKI